MPPMPPSSAERRDFMEPYDPVPGMLKAVIVALAVAGAVRFSSDQIKALLQTPAVSQPAEKK